MSDFVTTLFSHLSLKTVFVGIVVVMILKKLRQRIKYRLPPGPLALPLIGNYDVVRAKFTHEIFTKYKKKYRPVFQVHLDYVGIIYPQEFKLNKANSDSNHCPFLDLVITIDSGHIRVVVLNDIKVVTEAMITQKADFANRPQLPSLMMLTEGGRDIALANYTPTWKLHTTIAKKALRQYMFGNHLENVLHKTMTKCLKLMAEEPGPFDPEKYLDLMVFNVLNAVVFGESADLDDPEFQLIVKLDKEIVNCFRHVFVDDLIPILIKIRPTAKYRRAEECANKIVELFRIKFRNHEQSYEKAGVDTSKLTMYFALRYMASFPDVQIKVQDEIDKTIGKDRFPELRDRQSLQYGEATLYEVMMLGTVTPTGFPHITACDTTVGGYDIPKDTMVMINHWAIHRDPNYWKDADKFDPTRYLDENGGLTIKPESWIPFSLGRRSCLGESVAKPSLHLMFCSIMQRFSINLANSSCPEIEYDGSSAVLQPTSFKVKAQERKQFFTKLYIKKK